MAEVAKLVEVLFDSKRQSGDLSPMLRSDSSLKLGLRRFYFTLRSGLEPLPDGKLRLECWDQSRIQALASLSLAIAYATRCLSVEHVEPVLVAVVQKSLEFALCYLEKSMHNSDDLSLQMVHILEMALINGMDRETDQLQSCSLDTLLDLCKGVSVEDNDIDWQDNVKCLLQGGRCSKGGKPVQQILVKITSEYMQVDDENQQVMGQSMQQDFHKVVSVLQNWIIVHLGCISRLLLLCKELLAFSDSDEKVNLRKRLSFCARVFKLLGYLTKDMPFVEYDAPLLRAVVSFIDELPSLFRIEIEVTNSNTESSIEGLVLLVLDEFLKLGQLTFFSTIVHQNLQACVAASILDNFDKWKYNKSATSLRPPLAFFPRVVVYALKLIGDLEKQTHQVLKTNNFDAESFQSFIDFKTNPPSFEAHSERIHLLKKYSIDDLLNFIFPVSKQWMDSLMHLIFFLHSEGVKLRPKLERSFSHGTKASCNSEPENSVGHEDDALFGDLFSEGSRSVGSIDGYDSSAVAVSSISAFNYPMQAATELVSFLKNFIFLHDGHLSTYKDGCEKLTESHIDIFLSLISCHSYFEERTSENVSSLDEQRKLGHIHELCFELLHSVVTCHALSDSIEDYLVDKILNVENGAFVYNDKTLALLAHVLVCKVGEAGSGLRRKIFQVYVNFISKKVKAIISTSVSLDEILNTLPSVFHIEILLVAFHMSSENEKEALSKFVLSCLCKIDSPSPSCSSADLSCWALLVSRLVLLIRHMIHNSRDLPSSLLLGLKSKLREAMLPRSRSSSNAIDSSSWVSVIGRSVMDASIREGPCGNLLRQLFDTVLFPPSLCRDDVSIECLGLTWGEISATFSWILDFWRSKQAESVEDLLLERYLYVLCWDIPNVESTKEDLLHFWRNLQALDTRNVEHFFYFSHSILGYPSYIFEHVNFLDLIYGVLQHLNAVDIPTDIGKLGWDYLRNGSWLSLVLSVLNLGIRMYCYKNDIISGDSVQAEMFAQDGGFLTSKQLLSDSFGPDQVAMLLRMLSSLLKNYLKVYQIAFSLTFDKDQSSCNTFSPVLLLKHTGFDKGIYDVIVAKVAVGLSQMDSFCELLSNLGATVDKMSLGYPSDAFWESAFHGFPCHLRVYSGILLSCILNIQGIVRLLDNLLKVKTARGIYVENKVMSQIFESIFAIKFDRIFGSLHPMCEGVHSSLTKGFGVTDFESLFLMKHMEEFLKASHFMEADNFSINECMVAKAVDTMESLWKDDSRAVIVRFFLSVEDGSQSIRDLYGLERGDLLVLVDSLDNCNSELVNVKVLNFLVNLLSGEVCIGLKQRLKMKFLSMDLPCLSKWLEKRLLGSVIKDSEVMTSAKGCSVSLRESAMNFIMCLFCPSVEPLSQELRDHFFKALLLLVDSAFMLFDINVAEPLFNFIVQHLCKEEASTKSLLQHSMGLLEKLANDEQLPALKFLFGFLGMVLSDCGSGNKTVDKFHGKSSTSSPVGVGSVSSISLASRENSDSVVLSASQERGSGSLDCDATSPDEDEDDGTSDGEVNSMDKDDEDDNSERALASKVCTFTSSGSNFMEQHWYFCYTCDLTVSKGCCSVCAKVCHRGHRVVYSRSSRFFCDCGAGGVRGSSCQCLKPRRFTGSNNASGRGCGNYQSLLPFTDSRDQFPDSDSEVDDDTLLDVDSNSALPVSRELQGRMLLLVEELDVEDQVLKICSLLLPALTNRSDSNLSKEKQIVLGQDKILVFSSDVLQLKKAYKSGSLDLKIKADYSNAKELKSHLASGSLVKSLLSVSSRGRLAVGEGDKVAIFDVGQLIGQATLTPVTTDKANIKPLSKNVVRFEIVHLVFNPVVENYLAVAGYEDCQVLTVSHRGEVTDRLAIELALQGAYIRRIDWVPGTQVQLMIVTNKFVKIYDLSQDNISPMHYFTLPDDMIVDATLVVATQGRLFLIILSELGSLFRYELSMKGNVSAKPLKIEIQGKELHARGSSLYFSPTYKLLFLSYQDGTSLVGRMDPHATCLVEVSAIMDEEDGKLRSAGLHRWKEMLVGTGLFICFSSLKSNTAFTISMGEHEVFAQNMRHAVGSASPLVGITAYKSLSKDKIYCLVLHDDGRLQIYSHVPVGVDTGVVAISEKVKKLGSGILNSKSNIGSNPEFPLDFFERTTCITANVKLGGDAVRNGDSEGAKQSLASEEGYLESPGPSGFKITVSNSNPDIVMVGIRVHVGNTSTSHIPSDITIFQRAIKLDEGMRSWYDIPFTVAESLLADEEFTVCVGQTHNGSALSRIDSFEVYGRPKDEFGWKEKMDAMLDIEARALGCSSLISRSRKKCRGAQAASLQEQVVADGLRMLSRLYLVCRPQEWLKAEETKMDLSRLKSKQLLEMIFECDREPLLQAAACRVLQAVFPKRETYHQVRDTMRLHGVVKSTSMLSSRLGLGGATASWIIEEFTAQMHAVSRIALHRRSNLATFLELNGSAVVDGLMQVLWGILDVEQPDTQTMNNIVISSVELIYCYAECLALNGKETGEHSVAPAVTLFKKLIFSHNEAVQTASSLAISSRLLQVPFPKQTMLGSDDVVENTSSVDLGHSDVTNVAGGNAQLMVEEESITSSVQYCCDGCSTVPILRRRWHCTICPDFDLCETCYEVLDADRLPSDHSRDHPMTAIPIEVETLGAEGNEIHFPSENIGDSSLLQVTADIPMQNSAPSIHELETNESGEFSTSVVDPVTISASKRAVNSLLLSELIDQLKGWMKTTSGIQAIPVMQLFYRLSSAVGGPFVDSSKPETLDLEKLIKWLLDEINIAKPFNAKIRSSFGEVTILIFMFFTLMLRSWHQPGGDGSVPKSSATVDTLDKSNVPIATTCSGSPSSTSLDQGKSDFFSHLVRACSSLRQQTFVNYCMDILLQLVPAFKSLSVAIDTSSVLSLGSGCGALLKVRRELPAGNFSPFFSDAYVKSHRSDLFADYHRLLLENTFRLVYSLVRPEKHEKGVEKEKFYKIPSGKDLRLDGYQDVLCSYINNSHTTFVRRYARRLFLHLCGSKTQYYSVRDSWQFTSEVKKLYKCINKSGGFQGTISYERSVKIVKCLTTIAEVAAARPRNWQKYCLRHGDVLPFLMKGLFHFGEECVIQTLKLINLAFYTGKDLSHSLRKVDVGESASNKSVTQSLDSKKKKKGEDGTESSAEKSFLDMEAVVGVFIDKGDDLLRQFVDYFLLEWSSSSVRGEAKCVLYGLWHHGKESFKETLLKILLQKIRSLPMYGQNICEYTELVTCLLGNETDNGSKQQGVEFAERCLTSDVIGGIFETLHSQNELLANHPNSRIYSTLNALVEFDGYYLESEPCVACSSPEIPFSRLKLESLKSETKFTDNRIIVKCTGSFTIQNVTMNVHDARKSKSVKVLNLYYNNRPVADLSELKNDWSLWKRAKTCHLASNQAELKVDFPIPITACNLMIVLDSFYENLQALSLEPLQCPRCSRPVTDKHGICSNCHENAYQCRQCRNINYENPDSFLCNECGYSKYGRFEFNFMAKPSFTFDNMENDEDMKRGLAAIEAESENAHKRYLQLLGFKKPLLKIVSSIGENELDSQQKDSVQQMMVSLPGPSCKINRKIALLGVLYGEKCKAAFDFVSKSIQTLQGLRQVLMNYLHQRHSDNEVASSRFVVSRSPNSCYGCATMFVTQCLEMLQVLSKHPNSKKQLVAAGILSELFENNIHQGPKTARAQARAAICAFSEGDMNAVAELNSLIQKKVMYCLEHHRSMDIALATREELLLLSEVCSLADEFWESKLRVVFHLLFASIKLGAKHPAIAEHVILPCLRIISQVCTPPNSETTDKEQGAGKPASTVQFKDEKNNTAGCLSSHAGHKSAHDSLEKNWDGSLKTHDIQLISYSEWEKGASYLDFVRRQYKVSQAIKGGRRSRPPRHDYIALKYALRWKRSACKTVRSEIIPFELGSWVSDLILSACSQSIRSEMCMLINLLCAHSSSRRLRLLNLLMSLLPATLSAGENAAEYFELLFRMIESEDARLFLTVRGCLSTICMLITREVGNIESLERSLHINISQGFILHKLIELLGKFLEVDNIRSRFMREQVLSEVLEALIVIRGLIVQKTKLISDCNRLLKGILDSLLLESSENKRQFIQACITGLQVHGKERKGRTSLFIVEQLCNLIFPSKPESVYLLILNKSHTQEEFIRGSMTKNPYSSSEIGPLMRDVKNKICHQLDLLVLLEDDYSMELLVAGNIISLDLSIAQVYEQVWKKSNTMSPSTLGGSTLSSLNNVASTRDCPPMIVTYRLQGLDGEATEPMIKELDDDREESQDPEIEFAISSAVRECNGLEVLLDMIQRLQDDLKANQELLVAVLNLLMLCCKIRENRRALLRLGALGLLLETARRAFSVDAMEPAEGILLIVESLTLEANESDSISVAQTALTVSSEEIGTNDQAKKIVLMFLERLCHPSKQQRNTEMVARILPYLTYGEPAAMEALVEHFNPYLQNWDEFDRLQKIQQENPKDESTADEAAKQRFAVENFVRVSESLKTSSCGERLKDIILEKGIIAIAVKYLIDRFAFTGQPAFKSSPECTFGKKLPSVPLILGMLRGLSMGHLATQNCIDELGILPLLHALERVSGENEIGARAENLLDTLSDKEGKGNGFLGEKIGQLRRATRDEMRRRALSKRQELLKGLGMRQEFVSGGGERIVVTQPTLEGLEDVEEEEDGLACMVCREGYRLRPADLLGAYTFSKQVNPGVGPSVRSRGDCVYTTVSHFNIIHFQCHQEAKRADAALRNPKKEWDGAALRNNETLCNNLFPLRGPSVPLAQYIRYVDQYWDYLNVVGRADGSRLRLLTYDIVLMLARFATGSSFSADSRGGGKESNSCFLPFMIQMARHLLDHDSSQRRMMSKSVSAYLASSTSDAKPLVGLVTQSSGTEETVQFMMVSSLLCDSYESWLQHRRAFLQRGIYHSYMQQSHVRSSHHLQSSPTTLLRPKGESSNQSLAAETGTSSELMSIVQPMLVYAGMIEQLQQFFKIKKPGSTVANELEGDDEGRNQETWEAVMKERLLNVKEMLGFSKEFLNWLDEMKNATDLQEALNITGFLGDVLSGGYTTCEDFVQAAIDAGRC